MSQCLNQVFNFRYLATAILAYWLSYSATFADTPKVEDIQGNWWIIGNVTRGTLQISIDSNRQVSGSIYSQPIRGTWDEKTYELNFDRFSDERAKMPFQRWTGKLAEVNCNSRKVFVWEGTFQSLSGNAIEDERTYKWSGQSVEKPAPCLDLKALQGDWQVTHLTQCLNKETKLPDEFGLNSKGAAIEIVGNELRVNGKATVTIVNDLQSPTLAKQVGFDGSRVILLTTPNGQGLICSYYIENDVVEIAYPHTTSCHRGSGHIIRLHRQSKDHVPNRE
ncbi:MAG: hypothetical protein U0930_07485 [Pirellulales bacterium]